MHFFWKPYKSDVTSFIDELKAKKPTLEDEQRRGRGLLWDRAIDREAQAQSRASRTKDYAEGFTAFLERRPPRFRGE